MLAFGEWLNLYHALFLPIITPSSLQITLIPLPVNPDSYKKICADLAVRNITLVAVSKTKPVEEIAALYQLGHRDFGENYVTELTGKYEQLPKDIHWHFIGHLQSNKVKYIAPFVSLIHGTDSSKLLHEIDKQARKNNRIIDCLLQVHTAKEETKFGFNENELRELLSMDLTGYNNVCIRGLMGMASFTDDINIIRSEFKFLKSLFDKYSILATSNCRFSILSMGMSGDYQVAIEEGSNMVRIGTLLFGSR
jgi:PLP dependent protein